MTCHDLISSSRSMVNELGLCAETPLSSGDAGTSFGFVVKYGCEVGFCPEKPR